MVDDANGDSSHGDDCKPCRVTEECEKFAATPRRAARRLGQSTGSWKLRKLRKLTGLPGSGFTQGFGC